MEQVAFYEKEGKVWGCPVGSEQHKICEESEAWTPCDPPENWEVPTDSNDEPLVEVVSVDESEDEASEDSEEETLPEDPEDDESEDELS